MRTKRFNTFRVDVVNSALSRGYRIASIAYWYGNERKHFFLEK